MLDDSLLLTIAASSGIVLGAFSRIVILALASTLAASGIVTTAIVLKLPPAEVGINTAVLIALLQASFLASAYLRHTMSERMQASRAATTVAMRDSR